MCRWRTATGREGGFELRSIRVAVPRHALSDCLARGGRHRRQVLLRCSGLRVGRPIGLFVDAQRPLEERTCGSQVSLLCRQPGHGKDDVPGARVVGTERPFTDAERLAIGGHRVVGPAARHQQISDQVVRERQLWMLGTERLETDRQRLFRGRFRLVQALQVEQIHCHRMQGGSCERVSGTVRLAADGENLLIQLQRLLHLLRPRINDGEAAQAVRDGDVVGTADAALDGEGP